MAQPHILRILFVEDSHFYSQIVQETLSPLDYVKIDYASSTQGAQAYIERNPDYDLALVDLNLPGSGTGDFAREVRARNIPTIVFSGVLDHSMRLEMFELGVIDYITKDSPVALDHLQELVEFLVQRNYERVLVVSNDRQLQNEQVRMLENLRMSAWACRSMEEALSFANRKRQFSLALIGHELADGTGIDLIHQLRKKHRPAELAIIAIPNHDTFLAAQYLRFGADDFLQHPYSPEEFQYRIRSAVRIQSQLKQLEYAATRDFLTHLLNRRAFFEAAQPIFAKSKRDKTPLAVAMLDIDHFKRVNDTYGHDVGDKVITAVAKTLSNNARDMDILARMGGEEYSLLMPDIEGDNLKMALERHQTAIRNIHIPEIPKEHAITLSIGVSTQRYNYLDDSLKAADMALYKAKIEGRNMYVIT